MGRLIYGARGLHLEMEDRLLAHLQAVATSKLRRNEGFVLSWNETSAKGSGRRSVWLHDKLELLWEYEGNRQIELDRPLLDEMAVKAASNNGLDIGEHGHNPGPATKVTPAS